MNYNTQKEADDLTKAISTDPDNRLNYFNRAIVYKNLGKHKKAVDDLTIFISFGGKMGLTTALINRALSYVQLEEIKKAIDDYTKAIDIEAESNILHFTLSGPSTKIISTAYYNRALIYGKNGEYQKAIDDFTQVISIDNSAYYDRGVSYLLIEDYQKAINDFTEAIAINPDDIRAHQNRGVALNKLGENKLAQKDFDEVARLQIDQ